MPYGNGNLQLAIPTSRYSNGNLQLAIPTSRYSNIVTVTCYCNYIDEDSSCKEEKVEDFVFKLEEVVETKVAYFYTPQQITSLPPVPLTACPAANVFGHDSNHLPSGVIGLGTYWPLARGK